LQRLLQLPAPSYLHVPVVTNHAGEKLSKQTGAQAINLRDPKLALLEAATFLGLSVENVNSIDEFWDKATIAWANRFPSPDL
jgi:glutamyl-Q tRNA(Asp) synthetase